MAGLLIYCRSPDLPAELAWFAADGTPDAFPTDPGPDGQPGWVHLRYEQQRKPRVLGYCPLTQRWHKAPGGKHWIGWDAARPPTPEDLERRDIHRSVGIVLADGQTWQIPVARALQGLVVGDDGRWMRATEAGDAAYLERAARIFDLFTRQLLIGLRTAHGEVNGHAIREVTVELPDDEAIAHAVDALRRNYLIDDTTISALGLLTDDTVVAICQASVEIPLVRELFAEKKKGVPCVHPRWLMHLAWRRGLLPVAPTWLDLLLLEFEPDVDDAAETQQALIGARLDAITQFLVRTPLLKLTR